MMRGDVVFVVCSFEWDLRCGGCGGNQRRRLPKKRGQDDAREERQKRKV